MKYGDVWYGHSPQALGSGTQGVSCQEGDDPRTARPSFGVLAPHDSPTARTAASSQ